jgi:predicted ATPase/class 3 adenylate cyclase
MMGRVLPTGTVTFLFSDMEGSTRLVQEVGPAAFTRILERHNSILRAAFEAHEGIERGTQGDSFLVMFAEAPAAVAAAAEAQTALATEAWPGGIDVRVRMGLHTGVGTLGGDDYIGIDVNRAARVAAAAHGGQVLLSDATRALTALAMPPRVGLRDLGEHKLKDLARPERLFELVLADVPTDFGPPRTGERDIGNLPPRLTSFLGREADLAALQGLLRSNRLVTLTGAGGSGKTSLAIELARVSEADFLDGAWFVPLDAVTDADLVASTIATSFGLIESPGVSASDRLIGFFRDRRLLLVVDNFEQVLAAAPLLGELIHAASGLTMLVTSRAPLRLSIEQEFPVAPLSVPGPIDPVEVAMQSPAVRLFVERARRARPAYELTSNDAPAVAEICARLDGLPLGIELAASRIALLTPQGIAARLGRHLDLPGDSPRDVPERQRSLERTITWSHDLLEPAEQRLLARLSVFAGGCRLEEAEAVSGPATELGIEVIEGISQLVDHGLVQPIPGPDGARYRLLETIRMFASQRLSEGSDRGTIERRHAVAYLELAEEAASHLMSSAHATWLNRLTAEHDNLRAAVQWAIKECEVDVALRLGAACWRFWQQRGHLVEGLATMDAVLSLPGAETPSLVRVRALDAAGGLRWWTAEVQAADVFYQAQLALARELGDKKAIADATVNVIDSGIILKRDGEELHRLLEEARALYTELGDELALERLRLMSVFEMFANPDLTPSVDGLLEQLGRFETLDDQANVGLTALALAATTFRSGDVESSFRWGVRGIESALLMGDVSSATIALRGAALFLIVMGRNREAVVSNGAFEALCARYAVRPPGDLDDWGMYGATSAEALAILQDEAYAADARRGASMTIEEAVDYLRGLVGGEEPRSQESAAPATSPTTPGRFIREGDVWAITYDDRTFRIHDTKGLRYLAQLLAAPGREIPAVDLAAGARSGARGVGAHVAAEAGLAPAIATADPLLDSAARGAYRERLRELQEDIDEADRFGDSERAARAREEFAYLAKELTTATGLGGRARRAPSEAERARQSVSKAIRQTLDRIERHDRDLATHLRHSVRLGAFCGYMPDPRSEVRWTT